MVNFKYQEMYPQEEDLTEYHLLTKDYITLKSFEGKEIIMIAPEGLTYLAEHAFKDASFFLRESRLKQMVKIINDPESSDNERLVMFETMKNAIVASEGVFPLCQDTGTAIITGQKGEQIWTDYSDEEMLSKGIFNAYRKNDLRYSQYAPLTMYKEVNTGTNLPAQIELSVTPGDMYNFIFMAKGSGTANKMSLYQETKTLLKPEKLMDFMANKIKTLGTAAFPPYNLVFVVGGTSPEANLKTVKLATSGHLENLPLKGNEHGHAFRCPELEDQLLKISQELGIGAQFGGKHFCYNIRIIRLPRHGGSCPIGLGVSCTVDRHIKGKITKDGLFLEKLEKNPAQYLPRTPKGYDNVVRINLDRPVDEIRAELSKYQVGTRFVADGKVVVARDLAHTKLKERIDRGEGLPQYFKDHVVYYAGPAKTPKGYPSGSFGPTSGGRMDTYVPLFQKFGASLITMAKGNRSMEFKKSCKRYGGFYLCCMGGMAAEIGKKCITNVKILDYPELEMDAIYMITVKNFPVFMMVDDRGNDYFETVLNIPYAFSVKPDIT